MFKHYLLRSVSRGALGRVIREAERTATAPKGSVLHRDGTPVLVCDMKILRPYKLTPRGDYTELTPV